MIQDQISMSNKELHRPEVIIKQRQDAIDESIISQTDELKALIDLCLAKLLIGKHPDKLAEIKQRMLEVLK